MLKACFELVLFWAVALTVLYLMARYAQTHRK